MDNIFWGLGLVCIVLGILPAAVYLCVKMGRIAYLNASKQFDDNNHNQESQNGS